MKCEVRSSGTVGKFNSVNSDIHWYCSTSTVPGLFPPVLGIPVPRNHSSYCKYFQPVGFIYRNSYPRRVQMARRYMASSQTPKCLTFE